ncbi:MAG: hypothetical protein K8S55_14955, partial [Phycisphaerae bacterium]|nr:hypothetical protein [Phycisphaerae bacterium]
RYRVAWLARVFCGIAMKDRYTISTPSFSQNYPTSVSHCVSIFHGHRLSPLTMPPNAFFYRMLLQAEAWHPAG